MIHWINITCKIGYSKILQILTFSVYLQTKYILYHILRFNENESRNYGIYTLHIF
jgi:hypothetical protein